MNPETLNTVPVPDPLPTNNSKKTATIIMVIVVVVIVAVGGAFYYFKKSSAPTLNSTEMGMQTNTNTTKTMAVQPTSQGPFKYFQIGVMTQVGFSGEVHLNGVKVHDFTTEGSQISSNAAQDLIKSGENTIRLKIDSADASAQNPLSASSAVDIALHALNTQDFPDDSNRVVHIEWNPTITERDITYSFTMQKNSQPTAETSGSGTSVTQAEKDLFITVFEKKKALYASGNIENLRTYFLKTLPADTVAAFGVEDADDSKIINMASVEFGRLTPVTTAHINNSNTEWEKTGMTIQARVKASDGLDRVISIKQVDGVWY